ncbi:MAG TPA: hypothetical protein VFN05_09490 [Actinomycetes bacterium]|nr:hypothetical protein [Actinomycetes bacterium]
MRARWVAALALALAVAGCGGGEVPPTTPTSPPTSTSSGGGAGGASGVVVQERAFAAGGGSGIVASKRYPGVLWAIRDRGGQDRPGRPQNALYAYKVTDGRVGKVAGAPFKAVPMPIPARDWEDIGRDSGGNLWIADIGNNECDRTDTALHKVREPDPAAAGPAELLATYRYRFPDPPPGCAGRNAEAMFLVDDVPYLIDKAERSTLYRFPSLDPDGAVTLEKVGVLAGQVANLSGADLSGDRSRLAVDTHTVLYVYQAGDPSLDGPALVADLISRPPAWTVQLAGRGAGAANVEGVAFGYGSLDLNLLAESRDVYFVPAAAYER